jgi:hypothetical protein
MKKIRNNLSLATCSLLSQNAMAAPEIDNAWKTDSSILYYSEEERVDVTKFIGSVEGNLSETDAINIRAVLDSMAGPTPTGAVKNSTPSFSGASGGAISGGASSGALAHFDDTRMGLSVDWTHSYSRLLNINYNGAVSIENDYRSYSVGSTLERETENRAYKFTAGIAFTLDDVFRVGENATPAPLSLVSDDIFFGEGDKDTVDVIFGVTHVINRRTVGQLNLTYGETNGYLTDPYKVFSVVGDTGAEVNQYYESRPGDRRRTILTANLNHQLYPSDNVINLGYRYYTDDWEVDSHTLNFAFNHELKGDQFIEPNIRLYTQTKAYFYQNSIVNDPSNLIPDTDILPEYVSADYRLDDMQSITVGATYGFLTETDGKLRFRMAYMHQSFDHSEFDTNKAIIAQLSYSKKF